MRNTLSSISDCFSTIFNSMYDRNCECICIAEIISSTSLRKNFIHERGTLIIYCLNHFQSLATAEFSHVSLEVIHHFQIFVNFSFNL